MAQVQNFGKEVSGNNFYIELQVEHKVANPCRTCQSTILFVKVLLV
jgi:hypothetical protein